MINDFILTSLGSYNGFITFSEDNKGELTLSIIIDEMILSTINLIR